MSRPGHLSREYYENLLPRWRSLGIMFARDFSRYADPEGTILDSLPSVLSDAKMLYLIANWFRKQGDLIHVERLLSLVRRRDLPYDELMALGGLAQFASDAGFRVDPLLRYFRDKFRKGRSVETSGQIALPVKIGQSTPEPAFERYGLIVPRIIDHSSKIADLKLITETNLWIRNRIFFGCNWRADIYTALSRKTKERASTYRLAKDLGCSNETALRIRKDFELLGSG